MSTVQRHHQHDPVHLQHRPNRIFFEREVEGVKEWVDRHGDPAGPITSHFWLRHPIC